jgi:predicted secreted protein
MLDNDGFSGALNAARAISKSEEEVKDAPPLEWSAGNAPTMAGKDMLALDFGKDENDEPVFVAGGRVGEIDYSTNGVTWTQANNNGGFGYAPGTYSSVINGIAYGEDEGGAPVFVAVGDSDATVSDYGGTPYTKIAYSPNGGQDWKGLVAGTPDLPINTGDFFRSVAFGKVEDGENFVPTFVAGCNSGGQMVYSTNGGKTWTVSASGSAIFAAADCQAIAFGEDPKGNGVFVALGGNRSAIPASGYSYDGINWSTTDAPIFCKGATYANGEFVGSGQGGYVTTSQTGTPGSWADAPSGISTFFNTIAYGYNTYYYYVTGTQNVIGYLGDSAPLSPLGTYAPSAGTIPNWINQIAFGITGDGYHIFAAVGDRGTVLYCRIP